MASPIFWLASPGRRPAATSRRSPQACTSSSAYRSSLMPNDILQVGPLLWGSNSASYCPSFYAIDANRSGAQFCCCAGATVRTVSIFSSHRSICIILSPRAENQVRPSYSTNYSPDEHVSASLRVPAHHGLSRAERSPVDRLRHPTCIWWP
jgi:hypothetical protein